MTEITAVFWTTTKGSRVVDSPSVGRYQTTSRLFEQRSYKSWPRRLSSVRFCLLPFPDSCHHLVKPYLYSVLNRRLFNIQNAIFKLTTFYPGKVKQ
jgi:hypothetical protein